MSGGDKADSQVNQVHIAIEDNEKKLEKTLIREIRERERERAREREHTSTVIVNNQNHVQSSCIEL